MQESYHKALNGVKLNYQDWKNLINYVSSQIVRTPSFYLRFKQISEKNFYDVVENDLPRIITDLITKNHNMSLNNSSKSNEFNTFLNVKVNENKNTIETSLLNGRDSWLFMAKHLLKKTSKILHNHKWSIVNTHDEVIIPTSDDPVICLNYYSATDYNFNGGWGSKGSEIIFPLSPNKILYTQIGKSKSTQFDGSKKFCLSLQKVILEHSYRYIYSNKEIKPMFKLLPREVNKDRYNFEKNEWLNWNENQKALNK